MMDEIRIFQKCTDQMDESGGRQGNEVITVAQSSLISYSFGDLMSVRVRMILTEHDLPSWTSTKDVNSILPLEPTKVHIFLSQEPQACLSLFKISTILETFSRDK
jgi:hypothetical protein